MEKLNLEKLKYPIRKFEVPMDYLPVILANAINAIATFPELLKKEVNHLSDN